MCKPDFYRTNKVIQILSAHPELSGDFQSPFSGQLWHKMVFLSLLCNTPMLETVVIDQPVLNNHLAVPLGWRLNSGSTVGCIIKVIKMFILSAS